MTILSTYNWKLPIIQRKNQENYNLNKKKYQHQDKPDVGITIQGCLNNHQMMQQTITNSLERKTTERKSQQISSSKNKPKKLYN